MDALQFLKLFQHRKYTLAFLNEKGFRSFPCTNEKLEDGLKFLHKQNKNHDIYFMVNEGSGVLNQNKTACHSTENVIALSSIFLDAELPNNADPLPQIKEFCKNYFVEPDIIISSSPNRYHIYWLLDNEAVTKDTILKWKRIQALLHSKLSSDRTMTDLPQVLRIPGFRNLKKFCDVSVHEVSHSLGHNSLTDLYNLLVRNFPEIKQIKSFEPLKPVTEKYQVAEGERHEEILRRARKLYSIPTFSDEDVKCYVHGFIQDHVQNSATFLPGGKRHDEITRILEAAKTYSEREKIEEVKTHLDKEAKTRTKTSPFQLDSEFFYNAPGLVGDLTRYIVDVSDYPIPSHAFAAACSLVGFTKARYIQGNKQLPPLNYFLCLAPSGGGKTTIQNISKNILQKLQLGQFLEDGIASAQGLITFLSNSNGLGIIMYDEVKELFQTIQHKNAASYEVKISSELTKLYTAYASSYTPPTTKTQKGKKVILTKPLFSFLGYGHFTLVEQIFTKNNVLEGLLPRFIILNVNERRERQGRDIPLPSHIMDELRHNTLKSCLVTEEQLEQAEAHDIELTQTPSVQHVPLSTDAAAIYYQFKQTADRLYSQAVADKNGLEALFSRGCEQALRLGLSIESSATLTAQTLSFTTTLMEAQMQEFYSQFDRTLNSTPYAKEVDKLYETILTMCEGTSDCTISKRDLQRKTQNRFQTPSTFHVYLNNLIEIGRVSEYIASKPSGKKEARLRLETDLV